MTSRSRSRARTTTRPLAAIVISGAVAGLGYRARALATDGALAATGVGAAFLTRPHPRALAALALFFVSGSALSRLHEPGDVVARGSQRDARQVLANGGAAALSALVVRHADDRASAALLGALAAATADTWATEVGQLSASAPRMFLARTPAPRGTSGAVTPLGMLGSLGGACAVAALATGQRGLRRPVAVVAAGVSGALADTLLGELVQERRWCPACEKPTEAVVHRCGTPTQQTGGVPGFSNDAVNLACTLVGAGVAALLAGAAADAGTGR